MHESMCNIHIYIMYIITWGC